MRCHARSRSSASLNEPDSSPVETIAFIRFSSSGLPETATVPCAMNALRRNTSFDTPVSISPALLPLSSFTGTLLPVYTAEKSFIGALFVRVLRVMVISRRSAVSSMLPSIGAPDHGA